MSVLVIGPTEKTSIAKLIDVATAKPLDVEELIAFSERDLKEYKLWMMRYTIDIPFDFRVTYTHERQPSGLFHHISISLGMPNRVPSEHAIDMIALAFNLKRPGQRFTEWAKNNVARFWIEDYSNKRKALNFLIPLN